MSHDRFIYVTYIRTSPEMLWHAITDPETIKSFWAETWHESEWNTGSPWRALTPDGRVADSGEILGADPPRRLVVSWRNEFQPELREEGYSRCTYDIEPAGTCVKLTLTHEIDRADSKFIKAVSQGWPMLLASLKSLLETGTPLLESTKWPEGV